MRVRSAELERVRSLNVTPPPPEVIDSRGVVKGVITSDTIGGHTTHASD